MLNYIHYITVLTVWPLKLIILWPGISPGHRFQTCTLWDWYGKTFYFCWESVFPFAQYFAEFSGALKKTSLYLYGKVLAQSRMPNYLYKWRSTRSDTYCLPIGILYIFKTEILICKGFRYLLLMSQFYMLCIKRG